MIGLKSSTYVVWQLYSVLLIGVAFALIHVVEINPIRESNSV